jgi:hypothetical protein
MDIITTDINLLLLFLIDSMIMLYYFKKNNINCSDIKVDNIMYSTNSQGKDTRPCFKLIDFSIDIVSRRYDVL